MLVVSTDTTNIIGQPAKNRSPKSSGHLLAGADRDILACALGLLAIRSFFFLVGHEC